ncbi:unnamed protein product, partial [Meganyctiphanes norvegica]
PTPITDLSANIVPNILQGLYQIILNWTVPHEVDDYEARLFILKHHGEENLRDFSTWTIIKFRKHNISKIYGEKAGLISEMMTLYPYIQHIVALKVYHGSGNECLLSNHASFIPSQMPEPIQDLNISVRTNLSSHDHRLLLNWKVPYD